MRLAPLGISDPKSTYPCLVATCLPSLVHMLAYNDISWSLLRFIYALNEMQDFARTLHVQHLPQVNYFHGTLKALPKCTNLPTGVAG